jgi:ferredoxin-NAD(P)+ reductase (naphthalene dioxygenase ferredoxin-specific)
MGDTGNRRIECRVVELTKAARDVHVVHLDVGAGGPFSFRAGQYASLTFDGFAARDYSMANRPDERPLEFHIRETGDDGASDYVARGLRLGERVSLAGPFGDAWLRADHAGPVLAVAGSSGLAPIKSIVEAALAGGAPPAIHLYFGARDEPDIYLEDRFEALARDIPNFRYVTVLSEPSAATPRRTGNVTDAIAADLATLDGFKAYVAGPPAMVEAAVALLRRRGMADADIHADPFHSEAEMAALRAEGFNR